ncbi:MAG TPA: hypothetical protein VJM81_04175 [Rhizorhapis sp.]|nr:hypothetical protein [Rhizorhapis sp.]
MATQLEQDFTEETEDQDADLETETQGEGQSEPEHSEDYARRLGWKPKDEYKGDPDQWQDWKDFLDEDKAASPLLKAQIKVLKRRLDQADRRYRSVEKTLNESKDYFSKVEQRAYERAVKDLREKQRAAVALADEDAFDAATEELEQLNKDMKAGKEPEKQQVDPEMQRVYRKWHRENDWYGTDEAMSAVADKIADKLVAGGFNGQSDPEEFAEFMEEITSRVKKEFPHKFEAPTKKRSAVEGVPANRNTRGAETFDNLPSEAKEQFKRFEKMGIPVTKEQFTKDAWAELKKDARR